MSFIKAIVAEGTQKGWVINLIIVSFFVDAISYLLQTLVDEVCSILL